MLGTRDLIGTIVVPEKLIMTMIMRDNETGCEKQKGK